MLYCTTITASTGAGIFKEHVVFTKDKCGERVSK